MNVKYSLSIDNNEGVAVLVIHKATFDINKKILLSIYDAFNGQFPYLSDKGWTKLPEWFEANSLIQENDATKFLLTGDIVKDLLDAEKSGLELQISIMADGILVVNKALRFNSEEKPQIPPKISLMQSLLKSIEEHRQALSFNKLEGFPNFYWIITLLIVIVTIVGFFHDSSKPANQTDAQMQRLQEQGQRLQEAERELKNAKQEALRANQQAELLRQQALAEEPRLENGLPLPQNTAQSAMDFVRGYYEALNQHDARSAEEMWKNLSDRKSRLIRNADSAVINDIKLESFQRDYARVWVDVLVKDSVTDYKAWQVIIDIQYNDYVGWKIISIDKSDKQHGATITQQQIPPVGLTGYDELTALIRRYYAALERHDLNAARAMRKQEPDDFSKTVLNTDFFKINDARVVSVQGRNAKVWVDVIGKTKESGAHIQRWRGEIALERKESDIWLIASLKGLSDK